MIAVIDYGVGNLFSLCASLKHLGAEYTVTSDADIIKKAKKIMLPGVGAFGDAIKKLEATGLVPIIKSEVEGGKPIMGICLGMQLLFEKSYEYGEHLGLGFLKGEIRPMSESLKSELKIPHMGWNALKIIKPECPLLCDISDDDCVYYVHSYYACDCDASLAAYSEYGINIPGAVWNKNVYGTQFHPEKSGEIGLKILNGFIKL